MSEERRAYLEAILESLKEDLKDTLDLYDRGVLNGEHADMRERHICEQIAEIERELEE